MSKFYVVGRECSVWSNSSTALLKGKLIEKTEEGKWVVGLDDGGTVERAETEIADVPLKPVSSKSMSASTSFSNPTAQQILERLSVLEDTGDKTVSQLRIILISGFNYRGVKITPDSIVKAEYIGSYADFKSHNQSLCATKVLDGMKVYFKFNEENSEMCIPACIVEVESIPIPKGDYLDGVAGVYVKCDVGCPVVLIGSLFYSILKVNDNIYLCGSTSVPECKYLQISQVDSKITFKMPKRI